MAKEKLIERDHMLICGVTKCGKTTLAHVLSEAATQEKPKPEVIVYDPVGTPTAAGEWPDGTAVFDDKEKFLKYLESADGHKLIIIDEADDVFSHDQRYNSWIVRRGRHYGWTVCLITQRPKLVHPSARNQCALVFLFRMTRDDSKAVAADCGHDLPPIDLDKGDFLVLRSSERHIERHNIFNSLGKGKALWTASATISKSPRRSS